MVIVNADDWGRSLAGTDRIARCAAENLISSASAMVFMKDSERAAKIAKEMKLKVGLHLNLSEPFSAPDVPAEARMPQGRVSRFLRRNKYALVLYHPFLRASFRASYDSQYREFLRLYGHEPAHVDGHQHMHLSSNVLVDGVLPKGVRVRRSFSFFRGEKGMANRAYRWLVDTFLARRCNMTRYFFDLSECYEPARFEMILNLARTSDVELMTHPIRDREYEFLQSDTYRRAMLTTGLMSTPAR